MPTLTQVTCSITLCPVLLRQGVSLKSASPRDSPASTPHNTRVRGAFEATPNFLHELWGFELRSSYLQNKCSYPPSHVCRLYCLTDGHSYCFPIWAVTDNAPITIHVQICVWSCIFIPLGCQPRSGISESCNNSGPPDGFPKWLCQFSCPLAVYKGASNSTLPAFALTRQPMPVIATGAISLMPAVWSYVVCVTTVKLQVLIRHLLLIFRRPETTRKKQSRDQHRSCHQRLRTQSTIALSMLGQSRQPARVRYRHSKQASVSIPCLSRRLPFLWKARNTLSPVSSRGTLSISFASLWQTPEQTV